MGLTPNQPQLTGEVSDGVLNRRGAMQGGSAGEIASFLYTNSQPGPY